MFEAILAEDYESLDPTVLSRSVEALKERGAHRCWHKHSTFLQHLLGVHHILHLWGQGSIVGRVGLFHSAYSNSYVNLALFDPKSEREVMKELIGVEAEDLVHLFCIIDRQEVVVNTLLRQGFIPSEGLSVPHLQDPDRSVYLSPSVLRLLVVFTMADVSDQYFGWQDELFGGGGQQGSMIIPHHDWPTKHDTTALWPGLSRPGLWMSYVSQLAAVSRTYDGDNLPVPRVFTGGTLSVVDEASARDLYWSVVTNAVTESNAVIQALRESIRLNPWTFEPRVLLAQKLLHQNDFLGATEEASQALDLQKRWGTAWDKRLGFGAWVAWTRVLLQRAADALDWPTNSWDVNNFGLVRLSD